MEVYVFALVYEIVIRCVSTYHMHIQSVYEEDVNNTKKKRKCVRLKEGERDREILTSPE